MNKTMQQAALDLPDEDATVSLARSFAAAMGALRPEIASSGLNIRLTGDLGAGKTTFTRAMLRELGITGRVPSPTFTLVEDYRVLGGLSFHHFDFYRFASTEEFEEAGFRDLFGHDRITACEWSEKAGSYLPAGDVELTFLVAPDGRSVHIAAFTRLGTALLSETVRCC